MENIILNRFGWHRKAIDIPFIKFKNDTSIIQILITIGIQKSLKS